MPAWNELLSELTPIPGPEVGPWLVAKLNEWLKKLAAKRNGRNVIFLCIGIPSEAGSARDVSTDRARRY